MELKHLETGELIIRAERVAYFVCGYQTSEDTVCGNCATYAVRFTENQPQQNYLCEEHLDAVVDELEDKEIAEAEDPIVTVMIKHEKWTEFALFCRYHRPHIHWLNAYTSASAGRYGVMVSINRSNLELISCQQFGL